MMRHQLGSTWALIAVLCCVDVFHAHNANASRSIENKNVHFVDSITTLIKDKDIFDKRIISLYVKFNIVWNTSEKFIRIERCRENLYEQRYGVIIDVFYFLSRDGRDLTHIDSVFGDSWIVDTLTGTEIKIGQNYNIDQVISLLTKNDFEKRCVRVVGIYNVNTVRERSADLGGVGTLYVQKIDNVLLKSELQ